MSAHGIVDRFAAAGVALEPVAGGSVRARGHLTAELRAEIRANKPAILAELVANEATKAATSGLATDARRPPATGSSDGDEVPLEPRAAARRRRVLAFLNAHPNVQRAVRTDVNAEPGKVVVTIGLRGVGTGEIEIPMERYDARELIALIDKYAGDAAADDSYVSKEQLNGRSST